MSLKSAGSILIRVFYFLEYLYDLISYRIFGLGELEEEHVAGKVAIVTGSNTGIGKQIVTELADRGATVILACRNLSAGKQALADIKATTTLAKVQLMELDLASLASVRKFASEVNSRFPAIHFLINNAGVCSDKTTPQKTSDGFELHMGVNHLGHFLLTNLLLENLKAGAPSRVVNIGSSALLTSHLKLDDLMMENFKNPMLFTGLTRLPYNNSKMANALFTKELGRRLEGTGVTAYCLCPGIVRTDVFRDYDGTSKIMGKISGVLCSITPKQASAGVLYGILSRTCEHESGKFYRFGHIYKTANRMILPKDAEKLWDMSERLVHLK